MSAKLLLKPSNAPLSETSDVEFELSGISTGKTIRVQFENATEGGIANVLSSSIGKILSDKIEIEVSESVILGHINLNVHPSSDSSIISIYASIEEKIGDRWRLSDIAAFAFQVEHKTSSLFSEKINIYPSFVETNEKTTIQVNGSPHDVIQILINGKRINIRTDSRGEGRYSIRGIELLVGSPKSGNVVQKFPIRFTKKSEGFQNTYTTGVFVNIVPEKMKALQATSDPEAPSCAIFDPEPGPGLQLQTLDEFCFDGAIVGELSVFDSSSGYKNSRVGFCTDLKTIADDVNDSCRIYNTTSTALLPNGAALVAYAAQSSEIPTGNVAPILASRVYVANLPTSLKYRGNPVRNGTILKPPAFYHSVYPSNVSSGDIFGVEFRLEDGTSFEVQFTATIGSSQNVEEGLTIAINSDSRCQSAEIYAFDLTNRVDVYSENRFAIVANLYSSVEGQSPVSDFTAKLYTNQTLDMIVNQNALSDIGLNVVFLSPILGSQAYEIEARSIPDILRLYIPEGVNNTFGPTIEENIYCKQFVVIDSSSEPQANGVTDVNPLPYILDPQQRPVPTINPSIATRKDYFNGDMFAYVVAQAPVNNIYQLFFYSFRLGSQVETTDKWIQLTFDGENRNPKIVCDKANNLHVSWESDRNGPSQIYYGILGPSSRIMTNQSLMSAIDKEAEGYSSQSIVLIGDPTPLQEASDWYRIIDESGKVSIVSESKIAVQGNVRNDAAIGIFPLDEDENGISFSGSWDQLSYQVSFSFSMNGLPNEVLSDRDIDNLFSEWKSQFTDIGNNKYKQNGNIYTLDRFDRYFERIIPICGSYKFDGLSSIFDLLSSTSVGGAEVSGFTDVSGNQYIPVDDLAELAHKANVRHFMLALMPEKIRFKAVNTDSFFLHCERNELSVADCDSYVSFVENVYYTGRCNLCLLLATAEDESTGKIAEKRFHIIRSFGSPIDFINGKQHSFNIAVHYTRSNSDDIAARIERDRFAEEQNYRFFGDIIIAVNNEVSIGQSFMADFSDKYHRFEIGLGIPSGNRYLINEFLPYNGNEYEDIDVRMVFDDISIGPHSIQPLNSQAKFSSFDRNTRQMVVPSVSPISLIENGDFELSVINPGNFIALSDQENSVNNWTIIGGITYVGDLFRSSRNDRSIWLNYSPEEVKSNFVSDDEGWTSIIPHDADPYGGIAGTTQPILHTVHDGYDDGYIYLEDVTIGILYFVAPSKFNGNHEDVYGGTLHFRIRTVEVTNPLVPSDYDVMIEGTNGDIIGFDIADPSSGDWTDYSIPIRDNEGWKRATYSTITITSSWLDASEAQIRGVLQSINRVLIRGEYQNVLGAELALDTVAFIKESGIEQSFDTTSGDEYTIRFDLSAVPVLDAYSTTKIIRVEAGGQSRRFEFDISGHAVSSIDSIDKNTLMNWTQREFSFTAQSSTETLRFLNESGLSEFTCCIDNVAVFKSSEVVDETRSNAIFEDLLVSEDEFNLNYSLTSTDNFSQIPVTLLTDDINKSCDLAVDDLDKIHIVWESNRNGYWDIYYAGNRDRSIPFRFETRITNASSNSLKPSVGIDSKGRRLVAWHDSRVGPFQVYAATNNEIDPQWIDQCKLDESDDVVRSLNEDIDPYDPYSTLSEVIGCQVTFDFDVPSSAFYHFSLTFYSDATKTNIIKSKNSRDDISGWRVSDLQLPYTGAWLESGDTSTITYDISGEDDLVDKVLYVVARYTSQRNPEVIDEGLSSKITVLDPSPSIDISGGATESDTTVYGFVEYQGSSPISISEQNVDYFKHPEFESIGLEFLGSLTSFPGVITGDDISVVYFHFDPSTNDLSGTVSIENVIIKFKEPIAAIIWSEDDLYETDSSFAIAGASYDDERRSRGIEWSQSSDYFIVSEDRKTLTIKLRVSGTLMDDFRVITTPPTGSAGETDFAFYCPHEQSNRCSINVRYNNEFAVAQNVHFRVTAYSNPEKDAVVLSSFTLNDINGWVADSEDFPASGIVVQPNQTTNVVFDPDILPFEMFDSQNTHGGKQSLLCGVPYYISIDAYSDGGFYEIANTTLLCTCTTTRSYYWREDSDSKNWVCSGQGKNDIRVTETNDVSINAKVAGAKNNIIYISWQDYRYSGVRDTQSPLSPDFFFAIYDSENNNLISSAQGDFDRRITYVENDEIVLNDADILIDQFQNIVSTFHNGSGMYTRSCSIGCKYDPFNSEKVNPCMFTDGTFTNAYFVVGGEPSRDTSQYQKMRIHRDSVAYSTYKDLNTPIEIINDCFIKLDIIGVPGTYAYRLRNENDDSWTEWLPIGPDLPAQASDSEGSKSERDFFRAYFIDKERFVVPWIATGGNGLKRVCCEVLTYFGKTTQFCCDFMAIYDDLKYRIDFFFDSDFQNPIPNFNSYPVASKNKTETPIDDTNLFSITKDVTSVSEIFVRVIFDDSSKIDILDAMRDLDRYSHLGDMTIDVLQQGLNDYKSLPLIKVSDGIYRSSFPVEENDGVVNVDGLAMIVVNIPGQCSPQTDEEISTRIQTLLNSRSLNQQVSVFNNLTVFREQYDEDDLRKSFGDLDYYRLRSFGSGAGSDTIGSINDWFGGGKGGIGDGLKGPE